MQEITYLTSTTTLNPLSPTFFVAPNLPRPRKVLPDHIPTTAGGNVGGVIDLSGPPRTESAPPVATTSTAAPSLSNYPLTLPSAVTNYPSDPASTFIPLKRQASQQGRAASNTNDVYSRTEWKRETTPIASTSVPPPLVLSNATPSSPSMSSERSSFPSSSLLASASIAPPTPLPSLPIPDPFTPVTNHRISSEDLIETTSNDEHSPNRSEVEARRGSFSEQGVSSVEEEDEEELNRRRPSKGKDNAESRLTAIYRPESKETWSEQLKEAGKTSSQSSEEISRSNTTSGEQEIIPTAKRVEGKAGVGEEQDGKVPVEIEEEDALSSLMWEDAPEDEGVSQGEKGVEGKEKEHWKTKKTVRR